MKKTELIIRAIKLVEEAQLLVDEAVKSTEQEASYRTFGRYGFDRLLNNIVDCPFVTGLFDLLGDTKNEEA